MVKKSKFLTAKKKAGSADFVRQRAKVGKKIKRRVGETDASFKSKNVSLGAQSVARDESRRIALEERLAGLRHHKDKVRATACHALKEGWEEYDPQQLAQIVDAAARLLADVAPNARNAASSLLRELVTTRNHHASLVTAAPLLGARLGVALASLDSDCRRAAASTLLCVLCAHADPETAAALTRRMAGALAGPLKDALRLAPEPGDSTANAGVRHQAYRIDLIKAHLALALFESRQAEDPDAQTVEAVADRIARAHLGFPALHKKPARSITAGDWSKGVVLLRAVSGSRSTTQPAKPRTTTAAAKDDVPALLARAAAEKLSQPQQPLAAYVRAMDTLHAAAPLVAIRGSTLPAFTVCGDARAAVGKPRIAQIDTLFAFSTQEEPAPQPRRHRQQQSPGKKKQEKQKKKKKKDNDTRGRGAART